MPNIFCTDCGADYSPDRQFSSCPHRRMDPVQLAFHQNHLRMQQEHLALIEHVNRVGRMEASWETSSPQKTEDDPIPLWFAVGIVGLAALCGAL